MKTLTGFPNKEELREMKRQEVVRRAAERFGKFGYDKVSLEEIAADLGVTKAALYNYASSKSDLLMQCYEAAMEDLIAALERAAASKGTAAERLNRALVDYVLIMTRRDTQYLWTYSRPLVTEERGEAVQNSRDKVDYHIRTLLMQGQEDGSLVSDLDPKIASLMILGAINWIGIWFRQEGTLNAADLAVKISAEAMRGYLPRAP